MQSAVRPTDEEKTELKRTTQVDQILEQLRRVTDSPHPYTLGKCGTCNAAGSGTEKTTAFSAGPPYTPEIGQSLNISPGYVKAYYKNTDTIQNEKLRNVTAPPAEHLPKLQGSSSHLWHFVWHLVRLHGFLVVGFPTEPHFKGWSFAIFL